MALLTRDTKLLILLAIIAIITNVIPFYLLLRLRKTLKYLHGRAAVMFFFKKKDTGF